MTNKKKRNFSWNVTVNSRWVALPLVSCRVWSRVKRCTSLSNACIVLTACLFQALGLSLFPIIRNPPLQWHTVALYSWTPRSMLLLRHCGESWKLLFSIIRQFLKGVSGCPSIILYYIWSWIEPCRISITEIKSGKILQHLQKLHIWYNFIYLSILERSTSSLH